MKITFTLLAIALLEFIPVSAQIPTWPPGGTTPSPITRNVALPDGRHVPSTKRWNLVWADQIVPQWVTPGKVEFAAKNYVGTQKIFANQAQEFRAFNPNFLITIYHLAVGLNPPHNDDCPDPKSNSGSDFIGVVAPAGYVAEYPEYFQPWLVKNGIAQGSARYEAMFQHYDSPEDSTHRVWHQDPYWLMNMDNPDWTNYTSEVTREWMDGNRNEGCFFDVCVEINVSLYHPGSGDPAPRNFNWWQVPHGPSGAVGTIAGYSDFDDWVNPLFRKYFQDIYSSYHSSKSLQYLVLPNVDQMVTTVYDPVWMDGDANGETIDGAMIESFGGYRGFDMWQTLERGLRHITGRGKILIAQFYDSSNAERLRRTAMYMLIKNENSFLNILADGGVEWYPEYEIDLGDQSPLPASLDLMRVAGSGNASLWRRNYENGMVLCNTSDQPLSFTLPGDPGNGWSRIATSGGGGVGDDGTPKKQSIELVPIENTVTVQPSDGVILYRKNMATSVGISSLEHPHRLQLSVAPNPAMDDFSITFHLPSTAHVTVSLTNTLGEIVATPIDGELSAGDHSVKVEGLPSGIYFCVLGSGAGRGVEMVRVVTAVYE